MEVVAVPGESTLRLGGGTSLTRDPRLIAVASMRSRIRRSAAEASLAGSSHGFATHVSRVLTELPEWADVLGAKR